MKGWPKARLRGVRARARGRGCRWCRPARRARRCAPACSARRSARARAGGEGDGRGGDQRRRRERRRMTGSSQVLEAGTRSVTLAGEAVPGWNPGAGGGGKKRGEAGQSFRGSLSASRSRPLPLVDRCQSAKNFLSTSHSTISSETRRKNSARAPLGRGNRLNSWTGSRELRGLGLARRDDRPDSGGAHRLRGAQPGAKGQCDRGHGVAALLRPGDQRRNSLAAKAGPSCFRPSTPAARSPVGQGWRPWAGAAPRHSTGAAATTAFATVAMRAGRAQAGRGGKRTVSGSAAWCQRRPVGLASRRRW